MPGATHSTGEFQDPLENYDPPKYDDPLEQALAEESVAAIQSSPYASVSPDTPVHEAVAQLAGLSVACLLVEEQGKLVGLLTERDVLDKIALEHEAVPRSPGARRDDKRPGLRPRHRLRRRGAQRHGGQRLPARARGGPRRDDRRPREPAAGDRLLAVGDRAVLAPPPRLTSGTRRAPCYHGSQMANPIGAFSMLKSSTSHVAALLAVAVALFEGVALGQLPVATGQQIAMSRSQWKLFVPDGYEPPADGRVKPARSLPRRPADRLEQRRVRRTRRGCRDGQLQRPLERVQQPLC